MKKTLFLTIILAATCVPSFAVAELKLISGATTIDVLDESALDSFAGAGVVTYIGSVGSWKINVTTGLEGEFPVLDLVSVNSTAKQVDPIIMEFSDDGMTMPLGFDFSVGGTRDPMGTVSFSAWTGSGKFDLAHEIGSPLTFSTTPFSGLTSDEAFLGDTSATIWASIDLGRGNRGTASFDAALDTVPEPASIAMLGGALLFLCAVLRRKLVS